MFIRHKVVFFFYCDPNDLGHLQAGEGRKRVCLCTSHGERHGEWYQGGFQNSQVLNIVVYFVSSSFLPIVVLADYKTGLLLIYGLKNGKSSICITSRVEQYNYFVV